MKDTNEFQNYLLKCDDRTFRRYSMMYGLNDDLVELLRDDQLKIFTDEQLFKVYEDNGKIEIVFLLFINIIISRVLIN